MKSMRRIIAEINAGTYRKDRRFSRSLTVLRSIKGLTQKEMRNKSSKPISLKFINKVENASNKDLTAEDIIKYLSALGLNIEDILVQR